MHCPNKDNSLSKKDAGFTLVELISASVIGAMLLVVMTLLMRSSLGFMERLNRQSIAVDEVGQFISLCERLIEPSTDQEESLVGSSQAYSFTQDGFQYALQYDASQQKGFLRKTQLGLQVDPTRVWLTGLSSFSIEAQTSVGDPLANLNQSDIGQITLHFVKSKQDREDLSVPLQLTRVFYLNESTEQLLSLQGILQLSDAL